MICTYVKGWSLHNKPTAVFIKITVRGKLCNTKVFLNVPFGNRLFIPLISVKWNGTLSPEIFNVF